MEKFPAIEIEGLTKNYGSVEALRGVDLRVERGEIFGFLGPNGAGKTTTIRCLLDLIRPRSGKTRVLGIDPAKDPVAVRARTGYLPGELSMEGNLTVEEFLCYLNELRGGRADWSHVHHLTGRLELELAVPIKNLSKGNKQKIGLIQALMARPALLLLDEPTSGLDPLMQQEVYRLLREAREGGATVFFSSHVISEVEAIAGRVAIIRKGVIVEEAAPSQLVDMALRRYRIRFRCPVDVEPLVAREGITLLGQDSSTEITLQVEGEADRLIKELARPAGILAGALLIGNYLVQGLSKINDKLEPVIKYTPLYYYQGGMAVTGLKGSWLAGLFLVSLLVMVVAWYLFLRRDIRVGGERGWGLLR